MAPKLPVRVVTSGPSSPAVIVTHGPAIPCIVVAEGDGPSYPIRIDGGLTIGQTYRLKFGKFGQSGSTPPPPLNPPVADFTADVVSGNAPLTVNFTDLSTNTPTSWLWTFGDAGTSMLQNPTHIYATPGTYTVTLTATNADGNGFTSKLNYITANWTPAFATTGGGVSAHTWIYPSTSTLFQDSAKTTPVTADGDPVGAAVNQGSVAYDFLQAGAVTVKPTYKTGIKNGQPVLRFDGGDKIQGAIASVAQPMTVFAVAVDSVAGAVTRFMMETDTGGGRIAVLNSGGNKSIFAGSLLADGAADTNWNIWTGLFNGASSVLWINGISVASGDAGASATGAAIALGERVTGGSRFIGDIAEFLIYAANLSTADKNQVAAYLSAKFAIAYTPI